MIFATTSTLFGSLMASSPARRSLDRPRERPALAPLRLSPHAFDTAGNSSDGLGQGARRGRRSTVARRLSPLVLHPQSGSTGLDILPAFHARRGPERHREPLPFPLRSI